MELGSTGNYFRGAWEQVHSLGDLGNPSQRFKSKLRKSYLKKKPSVCFILKKNKYLALAPDPRVIVKCIYFHFNLVIQVDIGARYGEYLLLLLLIYYPLIIDFEAINNVPWNTQNA